MSRKEEEFNYRDGDVFRAICNYWLKHKMSPSIREIELATDITSTSVVKFYLRRLERRGYIKVIPHMSRGIQPTGLRIRIDEKTP